MMNHRATPNRFGAKVLIFLHLFLGLNGLAGGGALMLAPDGRLLQMPLTALAPSPFADFLIPGLLLFLFLGVYPLIVAYSLWRLPDRHWPNALNPFRSRHWSWAASLSVGVTAIIWIIVQIQWIPPGFLHLFIFSWGVLILLTTCLPGVRQYCRKKS